MASPTRPGAEDGSNAASRTLDPATRALCRALAYATVGRQGELEPIYRQSLSDGIPISDLREGALCAHLYAGVPRAIEAFRALRAAAGEGWPDREPKPPIDRRSAGIQLFDRVYGRHAAPVRDMLRGFEPAFENVVLEDAYGRILAREALSPRRRELMAVTALAAGRLPRQLDSHLRGALALGATRNEVSDAIDVAAEVGAPDAIEEARDRFERLAPAPQE